MKPQWRLHNGALLKISPCVETKEHTRKNHYPISPTISAAGAHYNVRNCLRKKGLHTGLPLDPSAPNPNHTVGRGTNMIETVTLTSFESGNVSR